MWLNITYYRFVHLTEPESLRNKLHDLCQSLAIKGTILLAKEGINSSMAGEESAIREYMKRLTNDYAEFKNLIFKETFSDTMPFKRLHVKVKPEIVTMGRPEINPSLRTSPNLPPKELKSWLESGKKFLLLDTRNDYEVKLGTFQGALNLHLKNFREFPQKTKDLPDEMRKIPVVAFCTGGIRCEKATPWLENIGFEKVYQLEGGILNYFKECGGQYWDGECFVFDNRIAVNGKLEESGAWICPDCEIPFPQHVKSCPNCT